MLFAVTLIVFPPAMFLLRKMVRRIRNIAHAQFTGGTRIVETMQETLQGLRTVKAFTLEDQMRARFDSNVGEVEHEANKWARVANRTSPLMETLGGFAIAAAIVYGGYRVIQLGSTPGEFFSFLAAFLIANEPAKRLARLNLEINSNLVGVRVLFEIIDSPASEPADDNKPALTVTDARVEFRDVQFAYRPGEPVLRGMSFVAEPGKVTALVGASGGGKSTVLNLILRLYEANSGTITIDGQDIAAASRRSLRQQTAYVGQDVFLFRGTDPREHRLRPAGRERERNRRGREGRACARLHHGLPAGLRHAGRRARPAAFGRPAPARRDRARADQERADHPARRGDRVARFGIRASRAGSDCRTVQGAHHPGHRAPALDHRAFGQDPGGGERRSSWKADGTTSCCAAAGVMRRSIACSSGRRNTPSRARRPSA